MIREPAEATVGENGTVAIPLGVLAESGLYPGAEVVIYSDGDGRIVIRRQEDVIHDLLAGGNL
ncbi:hypothetical protein GCM10009760_56890 [Kitasatospora kazusensis]|uniref:SpoVT-AbrB domain-containing protein n=1 Tax=Kitasatospora kazusensis TaxID=407974 RepID=A0ABN3A8I5_9ACTN